MLISKQAFARSVAGLALVTAANAAPLESRGGNASLPIVDLGYELHQATYNDTGRYYNFSNIRYAAPPIGDLRWRAPQAPAVDRSTINDGSVARICPQASPGWYATATTFVVYQLMGLNYTLGEGDWTNEKNVTLPEQDPSTSEDCLFLDVFVPRDVFENASKKEKKAPVLVWIYGGGYTAGSKTGTGSPTGLLERSNDVPTTGGVIFVALNYRLGAFGWLSGEDVKNDGVANVALHDQRFALEWVQDNIHLFGGDKDRVTVMGESAGGGSIMHQITAYGGKNVSSPFQQAIIQSPGWETTVSNTEQEATYVELLQLLNVTTLAEAREVSTEALMLASYTQVYTSEYGGYTYGPVTDGSFVPRQPAQLLASGEFDHDVKVMVGHNAQEGLFFAPPSITNNSQFDKYLHTSFPDSNDEVREYISTVLYPPVFDGSQGYTDNIGRVVKATGEYVFMCNTFYLNLAYDNNTYAYEFAVPPAIHAQDLTWTFFTGNKNTPDATASAQNPNAVTNVTVAIALQEFITSFAQTGAPVAIDGVPKFVLYGPDARVEVLKQTGITLGKDNVANDRCRWWQEQLYL